MPAMNGIPVAIAVLTGLTLVGCAGTNELGQRTYPSKPLGANTVIQPLPSVQMPLEKVILWGGWAAVAYFVLDPLAPNWSIEEARLPENHYHFSLQMKRYTSGGAGEARVVFHRRAKELMRAGGFDGYEVLEYQEGLESSMFGGQRTATGVIRLLRG